MCMFVRCWNINLELRWNATHIQLLYSFYYIQQWIHSQWIFALAPLCSIRCDGSIRIDVWRDGRVLGYINGADWKSSRKVFWSSTPLYSDQTNNYSKVAIDMNLLVVATTLLFAITKISFCMKIAQKLRIKTHSPQLLNKLRSRLHTNIQSSLSLSLYLLRNEPATV